MAKKKATGGGQMLTVSEAAALKGVTTERVYQWLSEGRLTRHEQYGRTLIEKGELLALKALRRGRPRKSGS